MDQEEFGESEATAWAVDPERVDPDDYPPGAPRVRLMTFGLCDSCEVEVHAEAARALYDGVKCPHCGDQLLAPVEEPEEWLRRLLRQEDELQEQL